MSFIKRFLPPWKTGAASSGTGLSVIERLGANRRRVEPTLPPATGPGKMRIHLFAGDFASKETADHYCFYVENNRPEDLTRDLPDAYIDTTHVEVQYNAARARLEEFLLPADVARILKQMDGANTLVIIAEPAFGGLAYALNDTTRLRYLGPLVVDV
jgi:hypothetical protein